MSIFQKVKEAVSTKDAASFYGIKVGRSGLCRCPFHNDNTPSMKVDIRYFCFGCGAKGDVIDFVGKLYGLAPYDSAKKIADDLGIIYCDSTYGEPSQSTDRKSYSPDPEIIKRRKEFEHQRAHEQSVHDALFSLHEYRDKLKSFKERYAPSSMVELDKCNPLFYEALGNIDKVEWMIDQLTFGYKDEQIEFIKNYKGDIENVKHRNSELI